MENGGLSMDHPYFSKINRHVHMFQREKSDMSQSTQVVDTPNLDDIVDADAWGRQAGSFSGM